MTSGHIWYTLRRFTYNATSMTFDVTRMLPRFDQEWEARAAAVFETGPVSTTISADRRAGYLVIREYEKGSDGNVLVPNELIAMYINGQEYKHVDIGD